MRTTLLICDDVANGKRLRTYSRPDDTASRLIQVIETAVDFRALNRLQRLAWIFGQHNAQTITLMVKAGGSVA
jgi:hypothetical protein